MMRALRACAAALLFTAAGCASEDDPRPRDGAAGEAGGQPRGDAAVRGDASVSDAAAHDAARGDAGETEGATARFGGDDHVHLPGLRPSPQGVVRVAFDVPRDAVSFVVTVDPGEVPRPIQIIQLEGPDGLLFSALDEGPHAFEPVALRNAGDFAPYSVMLPSAPELPLGPGRHELAVRAGTDGSATVDADVVIKRAAAATGDGRLAVTLWFVAGAGLDATSAGGDTRLAGALALFNDIYASAGISVAFGEPRDLAGGAEGELAVLRDEAQTAELLALLAAEDQGSSERALHIVFVARIEAGAGRTVRGKTTGLPGPPAHPALHRRGAVVVALETLPATAGRTGELLAHEAAHYLGLRHSSELDGERHDPLADTPECPPERASQTTSGGTLVLSAEDCEDLDGRNLLFYTPPRTGIAQDELTDDQAFVLRHAPLVR